MFLKVPPDEIIKILKNIKELVRQLLSEISKLHGCIGLEGDVAETDIEQRINTSLIKLDEITDNLAEMSEAYISAESYTLQSEQLLRDFMFDDGITVSGKYYRGL